MSQIAMIASPGTIKPDIETLTGDLGGAVSPDAALNLNLLTGNGLTSTGNPATNTITFSIDGLTLGTAQTIGAVTADVLTIPLGITPTNFIFTCNIAGYEAAGSFGCSYFVIGSVKTNGIAATIIPDPDYTVSEDLALAAADIDMLAVGNSVVFRVTGVAGLTINWKAQSLGLGV